MLTSYSIKNVYSHFEYKELTKVIGEPTLDSILLLHRQVKRNAQSIPTTLGGGQLGYLALVIASEKYDSIPNAEPFVRPEDPGSFTLQIPARSTTSTITPRRSTRTSTRNTQGTTTGTDLVPVEQNAQVISAAEVATQKATHEEALKRYYECQAVEQALRTQIIESIEPEYLDALRNVDTDMINESIPEIFDFLQANYGRITEEQLVEKEDEVKNYDYDPNTPVDKVFTKITLLQDLCIITHNDKTDKQLCQLAYLIFNRTRAFVDSLKKWNEMKPKSKTFAAFKKHMREEHHALKRVGALTIQDSSMYQANMLQQVISQQDALQENLQNTIDDQVKASLAAALSAYTSGDDTSVESEPSVQEVNNVTVPDTTRELLKLIESLTKKVDQLSTQPKSMKKINPRTGKPYKRYCWSCGCCDHWGRHCTDKKPGHKDDATFQNRMGGSNKFCLPVRE